MATSKEKFAIVIEAQDRASKKIIHLRKELAKLGGPQMVKSQNQLKKLQRNIAQLSGSAKKGTVVFSRFTKGIAAGNLIANVVTSAIGLLSKGIKELGKAILVAANVEELGNVLQFVGQRAGYTSTQLDDFTMQLRKSGIAQLETNQAMLRAVQGNIDLTDAVKIARIAQDAAVIGQTNSSEAFQTLIDAIVKGRVVLLKSLGIQGTFAAAYKKTAKALGKVQTELTETEKLQARMNLIFEGGEIIAGAYETAMGSASKQLRSMDRLFQDLQVSVGKHFTPALSVLVLELGNVTRSLTATFAADNISGISDAAISIGKFATGLILTSKVMFNFGQIVLNTIDGLVITPIANAVAALTLFAEALFDPMNLAGWRNAGSAITSILGGVDDSFDAIVRNMGDITEAGEQYRATMAMLLATVSKPPADPSIALEARVSKSLASLLEVALAADEMEDDVGESIEETVTLGTMGMVEVSSRATQLLNRTGQFMVGRMGSAVSSMVDSLVAGRSDFGEIFKGMAQDFIAFFIKTALAAVLNSFVPGLGSILGSMFDTPVNDRMAMKQGRDFMSYFISGALAELQGGTELAVGITQSSNRIAPISGGSTGGGGGMVVVNLKISGNVLSDEFIEKTIAPKLQKLVSDGRSLISIQDENITGGRNVRLN